MVKLETPLARAGPREGCLSFVRRHVFGGGDGGPPRPPSPPIGGAGGPSRPSPEIGGAGGPSRPSAAIGGAGGPSRPSPEIGGAGGPSRPSPAIGGAGGPSRPSPEMGGAGGPSRPLAATRSAAPSCSGSIIVPPHLVGKPSRTFRAAGVDRGGYSRAATTGEVRSASRRARYDSRSGMASESAAAARIARLAGR